MFKKYSRRSIIDETKIQIVFKIYDKLRKSISRHS